MRKVILDLAVTLDGFIEGENGEIDWCVMDDEIGAGFDHFLSTIDTIIYGRVSYDKWGSFQPEENATEAEKTLWEAVHSKRKVVFTSNTQLDDGKAEFASDIASKVSEMKNENGKGIFLYGGAKLITTFIDLGLLDGYRLSVHPTVLGTGKPLFENLKRCLDLKLVASNTFKSGVVQLVYETI